MALTQPSFETAFRDSYMMVVLYSYFLFTPFILATVQDTRSKVLFLFDTGEFQVLLPLLGVPDFDQAALTVRQVKHNPERRDAVSHFRGLLSSAVESPPKKIEQSLKGQLSTLC